MERQLKPELLDELPANDPAAIRSRADLRRLNILMGHASIAAGVLNALPKSPETILEIGAGDGTFLLGVVQRLSSTGGKGKATLLDQQNIVGTQTKNEFSRTGWEPEIVTTDLFDWLEHSGAKHYGVILANLFLHHFRNDQLRLIFHRLADRCDTFVGIEPRRAPFPLVLSHTLGLIGCNRVTRHDAVVSVRAGFCRSELSRLWPENSSWTLCERPAGLFSHLFFTTMVGANATRLVQAGSRQQNIAVSNTR